MSHNLLFIDLVSTFERIHFWLSIGEFTKRVREMSSLRFVTLYTLSSYPSAHKQLRRYLPNPFREFPSWISIYLCIYLLVIYPSMYLYHHNILISPRFYLWKVFIIIQFFHFGKCAFNCYLKTIFFCGFLFTYLFVAFSDWKI